MESIGRTWVRKGFLGFFSGNSAGSPDSLTASMLLNQMYDCSDCVLSQKLLIEEQVKEGFHMLQPVSTTDHMYQDINVVMKHRCQ